MGKSVFSPTVFYNKQQETNSDVWKDFISYTEFFCTFSVFLMLHFVDISGPISHSAHFLIKLSRSENFDEKCYNSLSTAGKRHCLYFYNISNMSYWFQKMESIIIFPTALSYPLYKSRKKKNHTCGSNCCYLFSLFTASLSQGHLKWWKQQLREQLLHSAFSWSVYALISLWLWAAMLLLEIVFNVNSGFLQFYLHRAKLQQVT